MHAGDALEHPHPAQNRSRLHGVRAERQHRRQRQHSGALAAGELGRVEGERLLAPDRDRHVFNAARHLRAIGDAGGGVSVDRRRVLRGDACGRVSVDRRRVLRHVAAVIGHQRGERALAAEDRLLDEQLGFQPHRVADGTHDGRPLHVVVACDLVFGGNAEERPVGPARGCDEQDLFGAEPLVVEAYDGRPGLGIVEHPARLALDARRRGELARLGRGEQRVVGHRIPEKVGESCRQLPATRWQARTAAGQVLCLDPEMKRGGLQDARDGERDRLVTRTGG